MKNYHAGCPKLGLKFFLVKLDQKLNKTPPNAFQRIKTCEFGQFGGIDGGRALESLIARALSTETPSLGASVLLQFRYQQVGTYPSITFERHLLKRHTNHPQWPDQLIVTIIEKVE